MVYDSSSVPPGCAGWVGISGWVGGGGWFSLLAGRWVGMLWRWDACILFVGSERDREFIGKERRRRRGCRTKEKTRKGIWTHEKR